MIEHQVFPEAKLESSTSFAKSHRFVDSQYIQGDDGDGVATLAAQVHVKIEILWAEFIDSLRHDKDSLSIPTSDESLLSIDEETEDLWRLQEEIRNALEQVRPQVSDMDDVFVLPDRTGQAQDGRVSLSIASCDMKASLFEVNNDGKRRTCLLDECASSLLGVGSAESVKCWARSEASAATSSLNLLASATTNDWGVIEFKSVSMTLILRSIWSFILYLEEIFFG